MAYLRAARMRSGGGDANFCQKVYHYRQLKEDSRSECPPGYHAEIPGDIELVYYEVRNLIVVEELQRKRCRNAISKGDAQDEEHRCEQCGKAHAFFFAGIQSGAQQTSRCSR